MRLTKFDQACFTLELDGQTLLVDPGTYTSDFIVPDEVTAIVITHEHPDHFDQEKIAATLRKNPSAKIIADSSVTSQVPDAGTVEVEAGDTVTEGAFTLTFAGGEHSVIYPTLPSLPNLGVTVNEAVYYPGDSLVPPDQPAPTLLLPVSAPWLKISESLDYLKEMSPKLAIPTHDAILSAAGKELVDRLTSGLAQSWGIDYLRPSGPIEV